MGKRIGSLTLVATLTAGIIALTAPAALALSSTESCFFNSINVERAKVGRPKLALANDLVTLARKHSAEMANDGTIYHNKNLGNEIQGNWTAAGENVGMGPDCSSIHDAFMASPGHRANILDLDFNQAGIGVVIKDGTVYVTEVFAGRKSSVSVPKPPTVKKKTTSTKPAAPKPAPKPAPPKPVAQSASPRTVEFLVQLVGMDAPQVDPATGAALGL